MMRNIPIKRKLALLAMLTSGAALLLAGIGFGIYDQIATRREMAAALATIAEMTGFNSASALSFADEESARRTLAGLSAQHHVMAACVYDREGRVFASYQRDRMPVAFDSRPPAEATTQFTAEYVGLFQPIVSGGEMVGTIYLRSDLQELRERLFRFGFIFTGVSVLSLLAAYGIGARLRHQIADPVSRLSAAAAKVAADRDYTVRVEHGGDDELGRLTDAFNGMLAQIQAHDDELRAAHGQLEKRVEERTSALQQAQATALRERARFQLIFEGVPVGISYYAGKPFVTPAVALINNAHLRICGVTRDEAADQSIFKRLTHPEDAEKQDALERQIDQGEIDRYSMEKRYVHPDGRIIWVVFTAQFMRSSNGDFERLSTVVDITPLKQAQEKAARKGAQLRFIFEAIPYSVRWVRYGEGGTESLVNSAFYRISGLRREQPLTFADIRAITHPDDQKRQDELRAKLERGEIESFSMEKRYLRADGTTVWGVLTINVYRGPDGRIQQEVATFVDITDRKQAELNLEQLHRQLLETSRAAGMAEVATSVLHNVGNVLNSVNVSATLVSDTARHSKAGNLGKLSALLTEHQADLATFLSTDPRGKMIQPYLATLAAELARDQQSILTELAHLRKNIDHIKEIVAMQQTYAKTSGLIEAISVPDLMEDALRMNAGSLARHDVDIARDYQARPVVALDKHKVLQILVNLIRNAKYACDESGRPDKCITLRITADDGNVQLAVADNGVGIPPENLTRIFNHGFTTRATGHGFGLHSGALAAKAMGGSLLAHSEGRGHGAIFVLTLPLAPPA